MCHTVWVKSTDFLQILLQKPIKRNRRPGNGDPETALRHTFASHMVMKGVALATVQQHLGHADIQTTMRYAHLAYAYPGY